MKTKETSNKVTCNQCGKQKTGTIEGICEHCGKFGNVKSTREQALAWWNSLSTYVHENDKNSKEYHFTKFRLTNYTPAEFYNELTGREIEEIWNKEVNGAKVSAIMGYDKPNQKQFKQFDKELFKKYIDKFSDEDKYIAANVLFDSLPLQMQKMFLSLNRI